jgi:hypothetical protein
LDTLREVAAGAELGAWEWGAGQFARAGFYPCPTIATQSRRCG